MKKRESKFERAVREQFRCDLESTMKQPEGRRLMLNIIGNICRVHRTCFEATARETDYALGRRAVGLELIELIDAVVPDLHLHAQKEYRAWREQFKPNQTEGEDDHEDDVV